MKMRVEEAAALIGAGIQGAAGAALLGAEVDSRRVAPGDLFIALPGERVDGHDFVVDALKRCTAALVRRDFTLTQVPTGKALLRVEDPEQAYQALAAAERARRDWRVLTLTGSVGKTTTKDMLLGILKRAFRVGANRGNRNSTLGLPAEILSEKEHTEIFIAEAGMNHAGELSILGEITRPDILLYTRIAAVHTAFFPTMDNLVRAKMELLPYLDPEGLLILNADDPLQRHFAKSLSARVLSYGLQQGDVHVESLEDLGLEGTRGRLHIRHESTAFELPAPGRHQLMNFLAAAAAASAFEMDIRDIAEAASEIRPSPHRGELRRPAEGILLVDDSYNASPLAMEENLQLLASAPGRRVAVLGEMFELGEESLEAHGRIGRIAAASADFLICVGDEAAEEICSGAAAAGMPTNKHIHTGTAESAAEILRDLMRSGDTVLVKASRGIGLDRLVALICGEVE